jgi:hypothetical protein
MPRRAKEQHCGLGPFGQNGVLHRGEQRHRKVSLRMPGHDPQQMVILDHHGSVSQMPGVHRSSVDLRRQGHKDEPDLVLRLRRLRDQGIQRGVLRRQQLAHGHDGGLVELRAVQQMAQFRTHGRQADVGMMNDTLGM